MKKRNLALRIIYPLAIIGVIGGAFLGLWQTVLRSPAQADVPGRIGNLALQSSVTGADAIAQISQLHDTQITLKDGVVATYLTPSSQPERAAATVWLAVAGNRQMAEDLIVRMTNAIQDENSPFSNLRPFSESGVQGYQVNGPGGFHYFYLSGLHPENVVWVSIQASDPQPTLQSTIKKY